MKNSVIKNWLFGVLLVAFLAGLQPLAHAEKILYVQNNNQRDTIKMISIIQAQGHDVTVWTTSVDGNTLTAAAYAADGYELLIVDEVIGSGSVGASFRDSPIPVINSEGYLYSGTRSAFNADTGLSGGNYTDAAAATAANAGAGGDHGQVINLTSINIVDPSHPLAAGLGAGVVEVFDPLGAGDADGPGVVTFAGTRTFITNVQVAAEVPGFSAGMCVFGVPAGAIKADGTTNLAKWVHLPWNTTSEDRVLIEPSFFLFEAGVAWALDKAEPTKIRDFTPEIGAFLPTNTTVSFSVDKVTASGSAVTEADISLLLNDVDVIGTAVISDGGTTWDVSYTAGLPKNEAIVIVASATAADGGFSARQGQVDTIDSNNFTFEAEDFNFEGGGFFDDPTLCDTLGGGANCYFDRVGYTNIDKSELDFTVTQTVGISNEVYRWGGIDAITREEWVDTFSTDDFLVRTQYSDANLPDWEVRNITTDEWMNYTRTYPTGTYNLYMRVSAAGALSAQVDLVDDATSTNQNLTKLGRFVAPSGTPGYALVAMTDDGANAAITLELTDTSPTTFRVTALTGGWTPNFFMLVPTEEAPNEPPSVTLTAPSGGDTLSAGVETTLSANPVDPDGTITNVQFYAGTYGGSLSLVGSATSAPWEVPYTPATLTAISYQTIQVVATDDGGLQASDQVDVRIIDPAMTIVSSEVGDGADASHREVSGAEPADGNSTGTGSLAARSRVLPDADINEMSIIRFDLTGIDLTSLQDVSINLVNQRDNQSSAILHFYAVNDGAMGADNNGFTPGWTDNTWDDGDTNGNLRFSTCPGVIFNGTITNMADQGLNANDTVDLGVMDPLSPAGKASVASFSSAELAAFIAANPDSLISFLVFADNSSSGQKRFASKEQTSLDGGVPAGSAGYFAPFLSFTIATAEVEISIVQQSATQIQVELQESVVGKTYQLQSRTSLTSAWADDGAPLPGTGSNLLWPRNSDAGEKYYRVEVQ